MEEMARKLMEVDFIMEDLENNLVIYTMDELQKTDKEFKKQEELLDEQLRKIGKSTVR